MPTVWTGISIINEGKLLNYVTRLDIPNLTPFEREEAKNALVREISGSWLTDEIRRHKPTPSDEAMGGFAVIEQNLCILSYSISTVEEIDLKRDRSTAIHENFGYSR